LKLYNTQTRRKELFEPGNPGHVTMYVCGITAYSYAHIGNARPAVVFDVLYRVLASRYPRVTYVRNITDIDDKINKSAAEQGVSIGDITEKYTAAYHEDMEALGVLPPDAEPRVTDHLVEIIAMIEALISNGNAYVADDHVLFGVGSYSGYGELSGRSSDELLAGARVDVASYKEEPGDFVLWKPSTEDQPGWDSPWGRGRPGWHIECSAMCAALLGETIDIHGGGIDLVFPHHENERAQSVCAHGGQTFAQYWLHNGYVNVDHEKMSKSVGNVLLVRDLLGTAPGEAIRYALLSAQYRAPLDWTPDTLIQARAALDRLYGALRDLAGIDEDEEKVRLPEKFIEALEDDLNTPRALAELFGLARAANISTDPVERGNLKSALLQAGKCLGLLHQDPDEWFAGETGSVSSDEIEALIDERNAARATRDFARSDEIREQLAAMNIVLEDGPDGTRWRSDG
jgi:cysteinyl-tRNA synthetase